MTEEFDFPDAPPDGVHPNMWSMLRAINCKLSRVNTIENHLTINDDLLDNDGSQLAIIKDKIERLQLRNKTLNGRLIRAESVIQKKQSELTDLRMRSMRDNIIIKTSGSKCKEIRDEDMSNTVRNFLKDELHIPGTDCIAINSSHRMCQAGAGYNKMLITHLPRRCDHATIFYNAKAVKGTESQFRSKFLSR